MAYLKGGSLVDGNLYVEGGLRVKRITDSSGRPIPSLYDDTSSLQDFLIKFVDSNGTLHHSGVSETYDSSTSVPIYSIVKTLNDQELNKVDLHLNDNSVISLALENDYLSVKINPGKDQTAKEFKLGPSSYIIPYSAKELTINSVSLVGVDASGTEVAEGVIPDHFIYAS